MCVCGSVDLRFGSVRLQFSSAQFGLVHDDDDMMTMMMMMMMICVCVCVCVCVCLFVREGTRALGKAYVLFKFS